MVVWADEPRDALYKRLDAYNRTIVEVDEDDFEEAHDACCDLEFAMQDIPAQTWAGVIAKARIAIEYADPHEGRVLDDMIPSLLEDILHIANVTGKRYLPPSETREA